MILGGFTAGPRQSARSEVLTLLRSGYWRARHCIWGPAAPAEGPRQRPNTKPEGLRVEMTLEQACPLEYQRAQCAFKDSMIH